MARSRVLTASCADTGGSSSASSCWLSSFNRVNWAMRYFSSRNWMLNERAFSSRRSSLLAGGSIEISVWIFRASGGDTIFPDCEIDVYNAYVVSMVITAVRRKASVLFSVKEVWSRGNRPRMVQPWMVGNTHVAECLEE